MISNRKRTVHFLFSVGLMLWLVLAWVQQGAALSLGNPTPTTTPDRLAKPPLPPNPTQADYGAQEYWFQCLPCHGDQGQGLTDEFRMLYPPEEQNCWESGCHGLRFYENGWTIPKHVPALIGPNALQKFPNAFILQAYIKASMPFQWPGTLDDETAWKLTAFLLRENGWWDDKQPLTSENAWQAVIPQQPSQTQVVNSTFTVSPKPSVVTRLSAPPARWGYLVGIIAIGTSIFLLFVCFRRGR